jgi:hypothetical protein
VEFVTDDVRAEGDAYGLQTVDDACRRCAGFNSAPSPWPIPPSSARLLTHSNVVLVPRARWAAGLPHTELRERQIFPSHGIVDWWKSRR